MRQTATSCWWRTSTERAAESHLSQHITKRLGNLPLQQANVKHLQAFVTTTAATGVTRKTLENILQTAFSILHTARMFGHTIPPVKRADLMPPREEALENCGLPKHNTLD